MLFCFQHFPLGDVIPSPHQSPMAFWTDKNVKRRVSVEKRSKKGLLLRSKPRQQLPQASVPPSTSFDPDTMLTHPCDRHTHGCYTTCNKKCFGASKIHCPKKPGMKVRHLQSANYLRRVDDDDGDGHDTRGGRTRVEEMTLLTLKKTHNMERRHLLMWMVVLSGTGGERTRPGCERTCTWN
ncbi:hypothetical protein K1719_001363 [Acacia pycnantha]|nr:hypothetical protein K1719_001363 [Acacia pycnantha]